MKGDLRKMPRQNLASAYKLVDRHVFASCGPLACATACTETVRQPTDGRSNKNPPGEAIARG
jgi:hypothetical protein